MRELLWLHNSMKLLIATFNNAKQQDYQKMLTDLAQKSKVDLKTVTLRDLNVSDKIEETGHTFAENSLLKAKFYFEKSGIPVLADDGGLEIPILNNEPGIYSRRWPGYEASDEELIAYTLKKLKSHHTKDERKAHLTVCLTFFDGKNIIQETGKIEGYISDQINSNYIKGYPYRALFIVSDLNKYYDELTAPEHEKYNHRKKAVDKLWEKMQLVYNK